MGGVLGGVLQGAAESVQDQPRWYLVHAQTGREAVAQAHLRRQGYQTFLPTSLRTARHARQIKTSQGAYFPGYLFVSLDLASQVWRPINGTVGVIRLFATESRPTPVPPGLVERLIALTNPSGLIELTPSLAPGDPVRLTAGPFAEAIGVVEAMSGPDRVRVLLSIMNRQVSVDLPQVECEVA